MSKAVMASAYVALALSHAASIAVAYFNYRAARANFDRWQRAAERLAGIKGDGQ